MRLMQSFVGLDSAPEEEVKAMLQDITSDRVFKGVWQAASNLNTFVYSEVFKVTPEKVLNLAGVKDLHPQTQAVVGDINLLDNLKGFLVDFPLSFLADVHYDMSPTIIDKEYIVPRSIFL